LNKPVFGQVLPFFFREEFPFALTSAQIEQNLRSRMVRGNFGFRKVICEYSILDLLSVVILRPLYPTHFVDQFIYEYVLKTHDEINLCLEDKACLKWDKEARTLAKLYVSMTLTLLKINHCNSRGTLPVNDSFWLLTKR
jgi:hypothetical protein